MRRYTKPLRYYPIVWDAAIALLIFAGLMGMMAGWLSSHIFDQHAWWIVSIISFLCLLLLLYGTFFEPKRINVNTKVIHIPKLPQLKIAIASDFHVGPYKQQAFIERFVNRCNAERPDLIVLPGDFLFDSDSDVAALEPLKNLHAPLGVYAVLGNHDSGQHILHGKHIQTNDRSADVTRMLEQCGITVLRNRAVRLAHQNISFALAGIDDVWMPSSDLPRTLLAIPTCLPLILLSHNPDVVLDPAHTRANLIVSGHTHGGQIRLPTIGSLASIPSKTGKQYDQGLFLLPHESLLALSHGIGETMCRARLFCPPEVLVLTVTPYPPTLPLLSPHPPTPSPSPHRTPTRRGGVEIDSIASRRGPPPRGV